MFSQAARDRRATASALFALAAVSGPPIHAQDLDAPRPIDAFDTVWIEEMTWMEVRDALAEGMTTAIVGTGGVEQNGPYLASGKHNFVLQATAEAIARELGDALVAPIIKLVPEGSIDPPSGHMRYHATISVRQETFEAMLTDVLGSLAAHGFENLVLIGDSGGNVRGMENVAAALNRAWADRPARVHFIPEYYTEDIYSCDFLKEELGIFQQPDECVATRNEYHDDYHYSSIMATVDPNTIRADQRMDAGLFSINGVDLSPVERMIENGRRLVDYRADITARAIRRAIGEAAGGGGREPDRPWPPTATPGRRLGA
ncbi:creatininase family protein [Candidatus Palauibacter sp.]|uniref:creatininase family protein n=1 Tax=Candidatus Palauibacter sp. TaxID=3101350 RepID=UPI003C6F28F8